MNIDTEKTTPLFTDIMELFADANLTVGEILLTIANVMYALGHSITPDIPPDIEEIEKAYYENPGQVGLALVLQSSLFATWINNMSEDKNET